MSIEQGTRRGNPVVPLFPPIDQWGALPFPSQPLTPHSLSRRVRDMLAGDLGAHRHLPVDRDERRGREAGACSGGARAGYSLRDAQRAWDRRRADLAELGGVAEELTDIDRRADELNRRAAALLAEHLDVAFESSRNGWVVVNLRLVRCARVPDVAARPTDVNLLLTTARTPRHKTMQIGPKPPTARLIRQSGQTERGAASPTAGEETFRKMEVP